MWSCYGGFGINRPYWGRGYATEGAKAALNYGFGELGREHMISLIRPENLKSIQVAKRLGEKLEGKTIVFGQEALIYGISREDWAATYRWRDRLNPV